MGFKGIIMLLALHYRNVMSINGELVVSN